MEKVIIFCYGTLMRGCRNHTAVLHCNAIFIGDAISVNNYLLLFNGYPTLIEDIDYSPVRGELFEIDEKYLAVFDQIEGHPHHYERKKAMFHDVLGNEVEAYVYFYKLFSPLHIKSGYYLSSGIEERKYLRCETNTLATFSRYKKYMVLAEKKHHFTIKDDNGNNTDVSLSKIEFSNEDNNPWFKLCV